MEKFFLNCTVIINRKLDLFLDEENKKQLDCMEWKKTQKEQQAKTNIDGNNILNFYSGVSSCLYVDVFSFLLKQSFHSSYSKLATAIQIVFGNAASQLVQKSLWVHLNCHKCKKSRIFTHSLCRHHIMFSVLRSILNRRRWVFWKIYIVTDDEVATFEYDNGVTSIGFNTTDSSEAFKEAFNDWNELN